MTGYNFLNWYLTLRSFHYSLYVRCILSWGRALGPLGGPSTGPLNCCLPRMEEKRRERGRVEAPVRIGGQLCCSSVANLLQYLCAKNHPNTMWFDKVIAKIKRCNFLPHAKRSYVFHQLSVDPILLLQVFSGTYHVFTLSQCRNVPAGESITSRMHQRKHHDRPRPRS